MSSTWGQQRHFHKSFYGCHLLGRTWARAVFSFQSPHGLHGLQPRLSHWDYSAFSVLAAGLLGVLQSLLAPTQGSHHNHFLSSLTWNLETEIQVKHWREAAISFYALCTLPILLILSSFCPLTFAFVAHPLLCKCKLNASQFAWCLEKGVPNDQSCGRG